MRVAVKIPAIRQDHPVILAARNVITRAIVVVTFASFTFIHSFIT